MTDLQTRELDGLVFLQSLKTLRLTYRSFLFAVLDATLRFQAVKMGALGRIGNRSTEESVLR